MTQLETPRLSLHAIDVAEGERTVERRAEASDVWADDYPSVGEVIGITAFLRATAAHGDQQPFGHYRISRRSDGQAIGGIGFKGRPDGGCAEIGYGLAPSARGQRYAAEALTALLTLAVELGVSRVVADTDEGNTASRRTLERAGFQHLGTHDDLCRYEVPLG